MSDADELRKLALPHRINTLIVSYEKEIDMVAGLIDDIGDTDDRSRVIYETMLREKTMFLQVLKNL
jgi:hypothetical protein